MKKSKKELLKAKKWGIISSIIFVVIGIVAIVVGFGISDGWESVLNWFTSRWSIYVYIAVAFLVFLAAYTIFKSKIGDN